jgi:hypothetical protein
MDNFCPCFFNIIPISSFTKGWKGMHSSPEGNVGKKKGPGIFFSKIIFLDYTDHEYSFHKIRSDPSWELWPFNIYWLIYHDNFNFDA